MFTLKHELETLFVIIIAASLTLFIFNTSYKQRFLIAITPLLPQASTTLTRPVVPVFITNPQDISVDSLDDTETISLKTTQNKNVKTYSFFISSSDGTKKLFFSKTTNSNDLLSLPLNAWDPDNKYVFIKYTTNGVNDYYVFSSSGVALSQSSQYVDIDELFFKKYPNYGAIEATGWGGPNLLIVNAKTLQGDKGPSFWFDVPSKSFIQLATRFD